MQIDAALILRRRAAAKQQLNVAASNAFEILAREWHANKEDSWKASTSKSVLQRLEKDLFPILDKYPVPEIKAPQKFNALRQIGKRGR